METGGKAKLKIQGKKRMESGEKTAMGHVPIHRLIELGYFKL